MGTHYVRTQSIIKNILCKGLILWGDLNARRDFPSEMALDMVAGEEKMCYRHLSSLKDNKLCM